MAKRPTKDEAEPLLCNQLKSVRTRLGLSQQELAQAAGVARQTIGGIEAGLYAPSAAVALRLARALGCGMEELFWLKDAPNATVPARRAGSSSAGAQRVLLGQVHGQWVAHPLLGERAFRSEMMPADGIFTASGKENEGTVELLDAPEAVERTIFLAGCSPVLALWARSAERWLPGLRVAWIHANSTQALQALANEEIHMAGLHFGEGNEGEIRRALPKRDISLINFGVWEEGLIVAAGNPKKIRGMRDLTGKNITFINREEGAGARLSFDRLAKEAGLSGNKLRGYDNCVLTHQEIARAVANGAADAGFAAGAVAAAYGLDFIPLQQVRYDLALPTAELERDDIRQMLGTLNHRWVRSQLQVLGGYDTTQTGEIVARLNKP